MSATDPLGNRKGRGAYEVPSACTRRNGEKLLFLVARTARGLSRFSPSDDRLSITGLTGVKTCPVGRAQQFLQCISRIVYFSAAPSRLLHVVSMQTTFPTWKRSARRIYPKLLSIMIPKPIVYRLNGYKCPSSLRYGLSFLLSLRSISNLF